MYQPSDSGSGTALGATGLGQLAVECRSVNGRGLTVKTRLGPECQGLEAGLETLVRGRLQRGTVYVVLAVAEQPESSGPAFNLEFAVEVGARLEQLAQRLGQTVTLADLADHCPAAGGGRQSAECRCRRRGNLQLQPPGAHDPTSQWHHSSDSR